MTASDTLCRDCCDMVAVPDPSSRCPRCGGGRLLRHPELRQLAIGHVDCDAFYASVEKRDRPELAARPLIIGGGTRGVVTTACYLARIHGVRSAMPMWKALALCRDAVVLRPEMAKYARESRRIRALMEPLTPLVQALSIDEAVLDLSGTEDLHGAPPAVMLARLARTVERQLGVTISIGLAPNRLLAKIAAERDKPRGFAVIGAAEAASLLAPEPVSLLPGIGPAMAKRLVALGMPRLGDLACLDDRTAMQRLGAQGPDLVARARGIDARRVVPGREAKSISAETTFNRDMAGEAELARALWPLAEKLARRLAAAELAAGGIVLKLKTEAFASRTRHLRLPGPTCLPDTLWQAGCRLLAREVDGTRFRLIGIGADPLVDAGLADHGDLADPDAPRRAAAQAAIDHIRSRFGEAAVLRGRSWQASVGSTEPIPAGPAKSGKP